MAARTISDGLILRRLLTYIAALTIVGIMAAGRHSGPASPQHVAAPPGPDTPTAAAALDSASQLSAISSQPNDREPVGPSDEAIDSIYADRRPHSLINRESSDIENPVKFSAKDSIVFYNQSNAHMFGNSTVEY